MARRLVGIPVDLHGGARDLIYPHHYAGNEIALALGGTRFSRTFLHTGFVLQEGAKMSKSTGNLVPIRTALAAVGPGALRWFLLRPRYTDRLGWSEKELARSGEEYRKVRGAIRRWVSPGAGGPWGASKARDLSEGARRDLAQGLRTDRVVQRLTRFAADLDRNGTGRVARGERTAARRWIHAIELRTGIPLL